MAWDTHALSFVCVAPTYLSLVLASHAWRRPARTAQAGTTYTLSYVRAYIISYAPYVFNTYCRCYSMPCSRYVRLSRLIGTFGRGYFARLIGILIEAIVSLQLYKSEANRADPNQSSSSVPAAI